MDMLSYYRIDLRYLIEPGEAKVKMALWKKFIIGIGLSQGSTSL